MNGREPEPEQGGALPPTAPGTEEELLGRAFPDAVEEPDRQAADGLLESQPVPGEDPEEREADEERPSPRIYVASLSDYNAGRLHGVWLDAAQEVDDLHAGIQEMLAASAEPGAEEWAIHDCEGFWPLELSEHEPLAFISDVAAGIAEHGEAFAAFAELAEREPDRLSLFEQLYKGEWESLDAYAAHLLEDMGVEAHLAQLPEWVQRYVTVDVQALVLELETDGSVMTAAASDGGLHVFDFEQPHINSSFL
jgi:antirestriction protein